MIVHRLWAALIAGAIAGCAAQPSTVPLGVGPLLPGAKLQADLKREARHRRKTDPRRRIADESAKTDSEADETVVVSIPPPATASAVAKTDAGPAAASGAAPVSSPTDPTGDYRGNDVSAYRLSGMPDRTEKDPNARVNVRAASGKLEFALVDSSNGKDICTLSGTPEGPDQQKAAITAGQACFEQDGEEASAEATVTRGTATFEKGRLVLDLTLDFALRVGDDEHAGTLEYHFDGARR
jgi:hypothetical protein